MFNTIQKLTFIPFSTSDTLNYQVKKRLELGLLKIYELFVHSLQIIFIFTSRISDKDISIKNRKI